ncbi:MAG: KTSC domain-containing protein [Proteobacteria bacterium]|nr:KTSC domain-containing protein [Pseudomonadota bacterium]
MAKHEKFFVDSAFIKHLAYDQKSKSLIVSFASGSIWLYKSISLKVYKELSSAPSTGNYFNTKIRNKYEAEVIARVGKSSVIVYSKGEEIVEEKKEIQET